MARRQIVGLLLGLCSAAGCGSTESDDAEAETDSTTNGTSSQTANTSTGSQVGSTTVTASVTATTSSSATTAGGNGSGGAGTGGTSTAAAATGVGGGAGNANATSETSTTAAGGSGGETGACPDEPPNPDSSCASGLCAYEDCAGVGRTVATCVDGAWSVTTSACSETVDCTAGGEQCSKGEICLILAGGAFQQDCVPNTCETGPVECDCIEGCFGECSTYGSAETGITITCNTCPNGMLCP